MIIRGKMYLRSKKNRIKLRDSEISGLIRISQDGGYKYCISDQFYLIDNCVKIPIENVSELLRYIRKKDGN